MSATTIAMVYAFLGLGSTGVGALKSTDEIKAFSDKYGKGALYTLLGTVTVLFPVALLLGGVMYWGKNAQAKKKMNIVELVEALKPAKEEEAPKE